MTRAIDIQGKSSRQRYYGKMGAFMRQGMTRDEARQRARGYAGGKTSRRATWSARGSPGDLPREAREIYDAVFSTALTDGSDDSAASDAAWDAVNLAGYTRKDGQWMLDEQATYRGLIQFDDDWLTDMPESGPLTSEIQIARAGLWDHPQYGKLEISDETIQSFVDNFYTNVRGIDLAVDQSHQPENGAAGWFKDLYKRGSELWARIEWTDMGAGLLRNGVYRYFSPEFVTLYTDPETGAKHANVLHGGGLTNRPFIKGMAPVMLSEDLIGELVCWPVVDDLDSDTGEIELDKEPEMVALNEQTRTALKLSEDATLEQIGAAVETFLAERDKADADAKKPAEENTSLAGQVKTLSERVDAGEKNIKLAEWQRYRDGKLQSGHLTKALSETLEPLYLSDAVQAAAIIEALPKSVELGERGTTNGEGGDNGNQSPDVVFLSEVTKYQTEHSIDFGKAMDEVTKLKPDLAAAYAEHAKTQGNRH